MGYGIIAELIIAALIAVAAAGTAYKLTSDHYEGVIAKKQVEADKAVAVANQKAENAAIDWQAWAEVQPAKIVYRDRKINDAFKADPAWAGADIPAAVRLQLDAAVNAPHAAASQPDGSLPATAAAALPDERGSGSSLSRGARRIRELFSTAPGAGASSPAGQP